MPPVQRGVAHDSCRCEDETERSVSSTASGDDSFSTSSTAADLPEKGEHTSLHAATSSA